MPDEVWRPQSAVVGPVDHLLRRADTQPQLLCETLEQEVFKDALLLVGQVLVVKLDLLVERVDGDPHRLALPAALDADDDESVDCVLVWLGHRRTVKPQPQVDERAVDRIRQRLKTRPGAKRLLVVAHEDAPTAAASMLRTCSALGASAASAKPRKSCPASARKRLSASVTPSSSSDNPFLSARQLRGLLGFGVNKLVAALGRGGLLSLHPRDRRLQRLQLREQRLRVDVERSLHRSESAFLLGQLRLGLARLDSERPLALREFAERVGQTLHVRGAGRSSVWRAASSSRTLLLVVAQGIGDVLKRRAQLSGRRESMLGGVCDRGSPRLLGCRPRAALRFSAPFDGVRVSGRELPLQRVGVAGVGTRLRVRGEQPPAPALGVGFGRRAAPRERLAQRLRHPVRRARRGPHRCGEHGRRRGRSRR